MAKGTVKKVILLGSLVNDPEVRTTQNGTVVATLSISTNDGMGENITTEWHRVVIFGNSAEAIQRYENKF
ncbi:single-stranded DNA-binding protein, partial [Francisella tularensis subsp. holarctica]|uniref:single-stranded DNA-binding protein n=1 Tax=Francisella tularensis TaxID=263 RepID=UPI0023819410